jgi:predicted transcriptional regulator
MAQKSGLGTALRRMMGGAPPPGRGAGPAAETVRMNGTRLGISRSICNRPGSHVRELSRGAGVAPPSVLWHVGKLVERGAVVRSRARNRSVFCPAGMVEAGDIGLLAFIGERSRLPAVRLAMERPGMAQSELTGGAGVNGHALGALASRGVLPVVRDGRHRRYYPAPLLAQMRELYEKRARRFRQKLLSLFQEEGLSPEEQRYDRTFLEVRVTLGTRTESLRLLCNPFALEKF